VQNFNETLSVRKMIMMLLSNGIDGQTKAKTLTFLAEVINDHLAL